MSGLLGTGGAPTPPQAPNSYLQALQNAWSRWGGSPLQFGQPIPGAQLPPGALQRLLATPNAPPATVPPSIGRPIPNVTLPPNFWRMMQHHGQTPPTTFLDRLQSFGLHPASVRIDFHKPEPPEPPQ